MSGRREGKEEESKGRVGREEGRKEEALYFSGRDIFITLKFISSPSIPLNSLKFQD